MMTNVMNTLGTSLARAGAVALGGAIEIGFRYTGILNADRPGSTLAQAAYVDRSAHLADMAIKAVR